MLKAFAILAIAAIGGGLVSLLACKEEELMDIAQLASKFELNLLIGKDKDIQGQFAIGYAKCGRESAEIESEIAPSLANLVTLQTRLSAMFASVKLNDEAILNIPVLVITAQGKVALANDERANLKSYLAEKGGFLLLDARGTDAQGSLRNELRKMFPKGSFQNIPHKHDVYNSWNELNASRFRPQGFIDGGRLLALMPRRWNHWECSDQPDGDSAKFGVNIVLYAVKHSKLVKRYDYTPVLLAGNRTDDGIEVKAGVISYKGDERGILTLQLVAPDGEALSSFEQRLKVSDEKRKEQKAALSVPEKTAWLEKHRVKYSWLTEKFRYDGNISAGQLVGELDTRILGQTKWNAGAPASFRLIAFDRAGGEPVEDANITARLVRKDDKSNIAEFSGKTDSRGTVEMRFKMPEDVKGEAELLVDVNSKKGVDSLKSEIEIARRNKILLSTDKPLYQPGQVIHIRSLALNTATLKPVGDSQITLEVEDSKGNKVFKYKADADKFGIAAADFTLADDINMGRYTIRAILPSVAGQGKYLTRKALPLVAGQGKELDQNYMAEITQEKKVTVDRYVLPKFKMNLSTDRDFYQPGETVKGELQVDYFFGKPVTDGKVTVKASKFDVGFSEFANITGKTDANGHYTFDMKLPAHFVGQPLEQGDTFVMFDISVVDGAEHEEKITQNRSVVQHPITIVIIPESGDMAPDVENLVYVMTTYPDGKPAETTVTLVGGTEARRYGEQQTDKLGVATFRITPQTEELAIFAKAVDSQGNRGEKRTTIQTSLANTLLLRTDEALYKVGDVVNAQILSAKQSGSVYIDLIKDKQTVLTKSVEMKKGKGNTAIHLAASDFGTLELHAYQITPGGNIVRDTRLIYVDQADDLSIAVSADKKVYLPGEDAELNFEVTDKNGHPVLAALGIQVVDESVFALQEMQPGLEKVYFTLEKELLKPKYEIHGYTMEQIVMAPPEQIQRRKTAAKVLFASLEQVRTDYSLNLPTSERKDKEYKRMLQTKAEAFAENIKNALEKYFEEKGYAQEQNMLKKLVEAKYLEPDDILDPWGNEFLFCSWNLRSLGPDGLLNTDDDVMVQTDTSIAIGAGMAGGRGVFFKRERGRAAGAKAARALGVIRKGMALAPEMEMEAAQMDVLDSIAESPEQQQAAEEPRVRQYFPETLFFAPSLITDEKGKANLKIPMADSITTWRLTSMASSLKGQLGSMTEGIRVFQDFFIDIDLPVSLTQNDEVSIPIAIYNYLPTPQAIRLKLTEEPWFELEGDAEQRLKLKVDQVSVLYYRLKVKQIGWHKLTVHAYGDKMSDAISRQLEVIPDGEEFRIAQGDRLEGSVERKVVIPVGAIDGASKVFVKIYPGVFSQVMEGLENILQMPFGCFEQTSSTTYPNILALDYMKATKQNTPELQMKAEGYINLGYQRLLSFEVDGGGFSWFGDKPANKILTAYGLAEFYDMSQVYEIDQNVITRTQNWLVSQQQGDGSWTPDKQYLHAESWGKIQNSNLLPTAYITWKLLESNYRGHAVNEAVKYIRVHLNEAEDAYTLAIIANALVRTDKNDDSTFEVMKKLKEMAVEDKDTAHWKSKMETITHSHGGAANIETTAMVAQALIKYGRYGALTTKVLTYLIRQKDSNGMWGGTQATILALKALLMSVGNTTEEVDATVNITINGRKAQSLRITPENSDVMRLVDLAEHTIAGANAIQLSLKGKGSCMYQVVGKFYLPWKAEEKPIREPLSINVDYNKRELEKDDMITCNVSVINNRPAVANMIIVDLGIPPGFEVQAGDLAELVGDGIIKKFNLTGRQIIIYFDKLEPKKPVEFAYRLRAKFPIKAKTRLSRVYEYYNPEVESVAQPTEIVVKE